MKLLYIAPIRLPTEKAHGVQIMKTCEAFAKNGVEVSLFVPHFFFSTKTEIDPFQYYNVKKLFDIKRFPSIRLIRFGAIGFFIENFIFFLGLVFSPDFWKSEYIFCRDEFIVFLSSLFGRKTIWETHTGSYNLFAKIALKKSVLIVSISQGLKDFYVAKGYDSNKIIVAHDSVDLEDFKVSYSKNEIREKYNLPTDKKIIMYVGRLDGWKGVRVFLDSSNKFDDSVVALIIGGDQSQINSLSKIYPKVIFWGYRPYKDLPMYQKAADVLVVPNTGTSDISRFFTSPLKVFAYMASGVPIIASDLPSIREILNESNSVLVESDNPDAFWEGINSVLSDISKSDSITNQALLDVKKYSWDERVRSIISFLNK